MRYVNLVQQALALCLLVCIAPASIAVKASAVTHGPLYATHQSRHAGLAKRAEEHIQLFNRSAGSRWTFYDAETGQAGSCGTFLFNTGFTVAMSAKQMSDHDMCFTTIRLTAAGKSTTATITDTCESCPFNGLDLTQHLFGFFLGHIPSFAEGGVMQGDWESTSDAPAAAAPANPPPPKKVPTVPITTTTKKPVAVTVTSSGKQESSTHISSSSSSNKTAILTGTTSAGKTAVTSVDYFNGPASALAVPTGTIDTVLDGPNNLQLLNQVIVGLGGLAMAARSV